jgi:nucleotide-binding universal stress UspA family protein
MTRRSIVVGVDDSAESRRAVALAWKIAQAAGAPLVPVHAVPDLWLAGGLDEMPVMLAEIRNALLHDSLSQIERLLAEVLPSAARAHLEVRSGAAAVAIPAVARARGAELIVLGGWEHGPLARGLGRGTPHYLERSVIRTLDLPLLVVGQPRKSFTRVLAAVDLSDAAVPTIKTAERFARLLRGELRIAHVVERLRMADPPTAELDQDDLSQRSRDMFDRLLAPSVREHAVVRNGPVAETIVEEAAAWHADLLVVGSHGKGWADRLLLGSTTERLLNALPTSLLVVPTGARARRLMRGRPRLRATRGSTRRP